MGLTSKNVLLLAVLFAVALFVLTVWLWPRLSKRNWRAVLGREHAGLPGGSRPQAAGRNEKVVLKGPPGGCAEPRMFTNAIKDGAGPKDIDSVTVDPKGKKFNMCANCQTWVPDFGGEVLTG